MFSFFVGGGGGGGRGAPFFNGVVSHSRDLRVSQYLFL